MITTGIQPTAQTNTEIKPTAQFFSLKSPLLAQGRLNNVMARTSLLQVIVKVYAAGGENAMHKHPYEDHAFIILQGQATFHIETDDNVKVVNKNEGVMIPRGVSYWFLSSATENLVMLRVGAAEKWPNDWRAFPDGRPFVGLAKENKQVERIELPGKFFAG